MSRTIYNPPLPPCPDPFNLVGHVLARSKDQPDRLALEIVGGPEAQRWTYGQIDRAVRGVAQGLKALGLPEGSRVLLRLGNSVEFPLAFLGAVAAGLLPVATPAPLTVAEISTMARSLAPALVIAGPGVSLPEGNWPQIPAEALWQMAEGPEAGFSLGSPDRPAYFVYTSGTSGVARAVIHAHRAIWARRMMWDGWYGLGPEDRLFHAGALNWTYTLGTGLLDPWAVGATALVAAPGLRPADLPVEIAQRDVTIFAAAPGVYRQMLKGGTRLEAPRLRHGLSAGERLAEEVRTAWVAASGTPVFEAFGMSECSTFISASPARPAPGGAIGYAQPGRRVAVLDAAGQPLPAGHPGVLAVHESDPGLFLGYHAAEDDSKARFHGEWFVTGDYVVAAEDGAIRSLGRMDDMMNAGGFRVAPAEVEAVLARCAGVSDCAATEVTLAPGKSIIVAFYSGTASPAALKSHAETHLASYKCPRHFQPLAQLPRTTAGKVNRRALREEWSGKI
ncbi:MAG: class I adenylate-forming enzyme family protein [Paracoccaceae bacterium]